MLINNLRISLRRLARQKTTTALHVFGLTLGMAACLLIGLFLRHELSYDAYHAKAERIYRINSKWTDNGVANFHYSTPMPMGEALRSEVAGIGTVAQWHPLSEQMALVEINPQKRFYQEHAILADPEMLDVFDIEVVAGKGHEALRTPYQVLLTESTAKKFFGKEDPIGKTIKLRDEFDLTVAGIIKDLPANTHMPATMLISFFKNEKFLGQPPTAWTWVSGTSTYVMLPEGADPHKLNAPLKAIADKYLNSDPNMPKHLRGDFDMQPLSDIHFNDKYGGGGEWVKAVNTTWLWFFGIIGMVVLALACINFINLSTAQALTRAREVGVRKTVGAGRGQLVWQFICEAWLLTSFSGILAVAVAKVCLPYLNQMIDKQISFELLQSPGLVGALLFGVVLTGLLAGLYPAWAIARFDPVSSLKSTWANAPSGSRGMGAGLRKSLVVAQFSISVALLIAVALIAQQVNLLRSKNIGFNKDNVVTVQLATQSNPAGKTVLASELLKIAAVKDFTFSTTLPSDDGHWFTVMSTIGQDDPNRKEVMMILADPNFAEMYDLKLLAGRLLEPADTNLASASLPEPQRRQLLLVNEKCVAALGFASPQEAIGKRFWFGMNSGNAEIAGVVADFNATSLHDAIKPLIITQDAVNYRVASLKVGAGSDVPATLASIGSAWEKAYPQGIFSYKFLDEKIDAFYLAEARLYNLFKVFAGLAMLISCLGLWGLATFAAQRRIKEIGIRKVLGASMASVVGLLSKEFLALVMVSLAVASPLAYFGVKKWLQDFAYRIDIHWTVFAFAGIAAIMVAFLTVGFQSIKAALANPVNSLRSE